MQNGIFLVVVIDGQGGGIGKTLVEKIRSMYPKGSPVRICAIGTNSSATNRMLKAGADEGATGENAVMLGCTRADVIIGPLAIIAANSMLGELTHGMATAISSSNAKKILIPLDKCNIYIAVESMPSIDVSINQAVKLLADTVDTYTV